MLASNYSSEEVIFTFVYIREAHASDEWPSPSSRDQPEGKVIDIPSHSSLEDRIELARRMKEEIEMDSKVEVLVDNMEDSFNKEFAAWPIRYFIAKEGRLLHKTKNSINNDLFDQVSLQNFFRGFGFVRAFDLNLDREASRALITMLHISSTGAFATRPNCLPNCLFISLSPCLCIAAPCFFCIRKIRQRIKRN